MKPIRIQLWNPHPTEPHAYVRGRSFTAGSWSKAVRKAEAAMPPVFATRYTYHRDMRRAGYAELTRRTGQRQTVEPVCHIVPSVGELGWSP